MKTQTLKNIKLSHGSSHELPCVVCGKTVVLHYNGGELDMSFCCDVKYALVSPQIDLVIQRVPRRD